MRWTKHPITTMANISKTKTVQEIGHGKTNKQVMQDTYRHETSTLTSLISIPFSIKVKEKNNFIFTI